MESERLIIIIISPSSFLPVNPNAGELVRCREILLLSLTDQGELSLLNESRTRRRRIRRKMKQRLMKKVVCKELRCSLPFFFFFFLARAGCDAMGQGRRRGA